MKQIATLVALVLLTACTPHYIDLGKAAPPATNLSSFIAGGGLALINGECTLTISYRNARSTVMHLDASICTDAKNNIVDTALAAQQAPPPKAPAPAPAPTPADPDKK